MVSAGRLTVFGCLVLAHLLQTAAAFGLDDVAARAKALANEPYSRPEVAPQFLRDLTQQQYEEIRFKPEAGLWREANSQFQVLMMAPGNYLTHRVRLNQVDSEGVHTIDYDKNNFTYVNDAFAKRIPADLGYTGFKITFPMGQEAGREAFLTFGGASYFKARGQSQVMGQSARGIAVNTGMSSGEQYPVFVEYWLERPSARADTMRVYALLNGASVTGAYQFAIYPGEPTRLEVTARLFPRQDIQLLGIAPLTSMFYYGENTLRPLGEWRPQVHNSDGLLINDAESEEWLWRPLINPRDLRINYLKTKRLAGFGLLQRDRQFSQFEDLEKRYDLRPSTWIVPKGDWGPGNVVLVEIPSKAENNDNIVAFWRSEQPVKAGEEIQREYTLLFGDDTITPNPMAQAQQTFIGHGDRLGGGTVENAYRINVDFAGSKLDRLSSTASVVSSVTPGQGVEILEHFVEYVEPEKAWRLSILARPDPEATLALRAFLSLDDEALTETWTYDLPAGADIRRTSR